MRIVFSIIMVLSAAVSTFACTCVIDPINKRFRKAEAIFVGQLADYGGVTNSDIQNFDEGRPVFQVTKRIKGISKSYVAINLDWDEIGDAGMCPVLFVFDEDKDYLIFAYGDNLTIRSVCTDSRKSKTQYSEWDEQTALEIRKMQSFWFRTKSRLWPF